MRPWLFAATLLIAASPMAGQIPLRPIPLSATPSTATGEAPAPHRIVPVESVCPEESDHAPSPPLSTPYTEADVDRPPELITPGPRKYPPDMERAGVGGRAQFSFVIDTLGHPEPCSFHAIAATNASFEVAAFRMVLGSLFRPAEVNGHKVRVKVMQAVTFNP